MHLCNGLGGLVRRGEAHKAKALALAFVVSRSRNGSDLAEGLKQGTQTCLVGVLIQVLHIQVHTLLLWLLAARELLPQFRLPFPLRLRALHVELAHRMAIRANLLLLALLLGLLDLLRCSHILHVHLLYALLRLLARLEVDEGELPALVVRSNRHGRDGPKLTKLSVDLGLIPVLRETLAVQIGVVRKVWLLPISTLHELAHLHSLLSNLHAVHTLDGLLCRFLCLVVDKAIAVGLTCGVGSDLARQDASKQAESVVQGLVVNALVQVLHIDIASTALPQARVALAPHDATRAALDARVVQRVQCPLRVRHAVEVDVAVTQGAACDAVAAHANRGHGPHGIENLVEHGLRDVGMKITDIERGKLRDAATRCHRCLLACTQNTTQIRSLWKAQTSPQARVL
mmetsp:Transcript_150764/g.366142  ORF Transcript_150764/g.366142 Transcript_150764/m.366142 type:complete len:400 (-) Transcript_150764:54-1253(-)